MSKSRDYVATKDGFIAGHRVREGERISLTPAQAKYAHVAPAPAQKATRRRATEESV